MLEAISVDGELDADHSNLATELERCIYSNHKKHEKKYLSQVRSRIFNLKHQKNLRVNFINGVTSPAQLVPMSSHNMVSEEMKNYRQTIIQDGIHQATLANADQDDRAPSADFADLKCDRCQQRCRYDQIQTLASDEPMTLFIRCLSCGNRWTMT